jgi:hypothetical protein
MGYPDGITYPILFTTGDIRVECIVRLSPSISRIVLSSNGPVDLSATQIEHARNSIDPGSRESECCSRFGIAICSPPVMEITGRIRGAYAISILDIRRLYTPAAYMRVPRAGNFAIQHYTANARYLSPNVSPMLL